MLIDPGKLTDDALDSLLKDISTSEVSSILIGGSLVDQSELKRCVERAKELSHKPIVLFPGGHLQVDVHADAILFTSLISGRNPEWLIGQQVRSSWDVWNSPLEVLPTGYILIDGGIDSAVSYLSNTSPIPAGKDEILISTVLAGKLLGMKHFYLESGSGAKRTISAESIVNLKKVVDDYIWVGGGIMNGEDVRRMAQAKVDMIVVGTALEQNPKKLGSLLEGLL